MSVLEPCAHCCMERRNCSKFVLMSDGVAVRSFVIACCIFIPSALVSGMRLPVRLIRLPTKEIFLLYSSVATSAGALSRKHCITCEIVRLVTSSCGYPNFSLWLLTNASSNETTSAGNNWVMMVHASLHETLYNWWLRHQISNDSTSL